MSECDENRNIIQTHFNRKTIEKKLIEYNKEHFSKLCWTKVYQDLIYNKLAENEIRDAILNRIISRDDFQSDKVYEFLKLLKLQSLIIETN